MAQSMGLCTALNLTDSVNCNMTATSVNGLFCSFHSRQCQGMYRGYKNRNARHDKLDNSPPRFLAESRTPLANQDFKDISSESILHEVYDHLSLKNALLERVIRARKTHHSHFFSSNLDYGHQHYLDNLSNQKFIVVRALERLERRVAEVLYEKRKWFKWVRECQDTEEAQRDNEKKKVKQEAALFRRHQRELRLRTQELQARENARRQDAELDKAYYERLSQQALEEVEEEWDPIEDIVENERRTYVDLIKNFLFMPEQSSDLAGAKASSSDEQSSFCPKATTTPEGPTAVAVTKSKKAKKKAITQTGEAVPDKANHETPAEIRKRLKEGVELNYASGFHMAGTIDAPVELKDRTAPVPDEEIDRMLEELAEIKLLLFCRLLLSHATVLPAALRAATVEDFLNDKDVSDTDLRDLCLNMDNPELQEIRDACADLGRGAEESEDEDDELLDEELSKTERLAKKLGLTPRLRKGAIPDRWSSEREKRVKKQGDVPQDLMDQISEKPMIDFGNVDDEGNFQSRKIRVRICGKDIYNYRSEKAISRGGWLHFSILAKESDLHKAIELCRNWDEFWELNILSIFQYFPAANWLVWKGDRRRQQFLEKGLIPYFEFGGAEKASSSHQTSSRGHQFRRAHAIAEYRNFMCCHIKRNDPASRRFCQYLSLQSSRVVVLIRDAKTGKILVKPPESPEQQTWLVRQKSGLGRASKDEWTVTSEIGPKFFEVIDKHRNWHFSFNEFYDIYIWDLEPGVPYSWLYSTVHDTLVKALQCCDMKDMYKQAVPILKTLTRDPVTFRTRDIKEGEESLWDVIQHGQSYYVDTNTGKIAENQHQELFYNEADALEDCILFPDEGNALFKPHSNALAKLEGRMPNMLRFIQDLDTDEETDPSDTEEGYDRSIENSSDGSKAHRLAAQKGKYDSSDSSDMESQISEDSLDSEIEDDPSSETFDIRQHIKGTSVEDRKDLAVLTGWKAPPRLELRRMDPDCEFRTFLDREKSISFKEAWHKADFTPNAEEMYTEACQIVKHMEKYNFKKAMFRWCRDLRFLGVHPDTNRRTVHDAEQARATIMLFFPSDFRESKYGEGHRESLILKQQDRANRGPPKTRSHISNKFRPKNFWTDWDILKSSRTFGFEDIPRDWDITIRPLIAKLYKEGVIGNAHFPVTPGQAISRTEPGLEPDLYFDYRVTQDDITFPKGVELHPPTTEQLLLNARTFANIHPNARFSLLRVWSAPHFYPLMLGWNNRESTSFTDIIGRAWEWKFIPKDMPYSEISMHQTLRARLQPYHHILGKNVIVSRDRFLVMGTDEAELAKYSIAMTFAIQTEPWRLEVDLWRSFVNVDVGFLEELQTGWLD